MVQSIGLSTTAMTSFTRPSGPPPPDPQEVFQSHDSDGDGSLKADELQAMLDEIAEKMSGGGDLTAEDLLAKLDADDDGALSADEFAAGRPEGPPPTSGYAPDGSQTDEVQRLGLSLKA